MHLSINRAAVMQAVAKGAIALFLVGAVSLVAAIITYATPRDSQSNDVMSLRLQAMEDARQAGQNTYSFRIDKAPPPLAP